MGDILVDVVIVGAGMAGVAAAHTLLQKDMMKIVVLEASDRIGGRVHTVPFGNKDVNFVELGANWIHGGVPANPIYTIAAENDMLLRDEKYPLYLDRRNGIHIYHTPNGRAIDPDLALKAYDMFIKADDDSNLVDDESDWTLADYMDYSLTEELKKFEEYETSDVTYVFNCLRNWLSFHVADTLDKVSLAHYNLYKEIPGGDMMLPYGYLSIVEALANKFPPGTIRLNNKVKNIKWRVEEEKHSEDSFFSAVECVNGDVYIAKQVLVTLPLGYLKKYHTTLFDPMLPKYKREAIERLGFGRVNKVFLEFAKPFWASNFKSIRLAWTETVQQKPISNPADWVRSIFSFEVVLNNPRVLVTWLSGDGAELMEQLSESRIVSDCVQVLRQFTGNPMIPEPIKMIRSRWCSDPLTLGSYSYHAIAGRGLEDIFDLIHPLPNNDMPTLLFAGESTHPKYYSTVHGALLTGIREADRIIDMQ